MDKINRQKAHFDSIADEYTLKRRGSKQRMLHRLIYADLLSNMGNKSNDCLYVLEPMCGFGEGQEIIKNHISDNIVYEGFDLSEKVVENAKRIYKGINVYVQDVTKFTPERRYDIVVLIGGLHHVPDYAALVLEKIYGALKPGGQFINVEPTYNNWLTRIVCEYIYKKNSVFDEKTERRFSLSSINELYKKNGFSITKQLNAGLLAYLLWYNPDAFPLFNFGNCSLVKVVYAIDRKFMNTWIGRKLSVATFSVLKKI